MEALKEKVIEKLQTIFDPEIPVSIYELGLIYFGESIFCREASKQVERRR